MTNIAKRSSKNKKSTKKAKNPTLTAWAVFDNNELQDVLLTRSSARAHKTALFPTGSVKKVLVQTV